MAPSWDNSHLENFFDSLEEIESYLPGKIYSQFQELRKKLDNDKLRSLWSFPTSQSILFLDQLNEALAECHILKQQRASIKKKTYLFDHSERNTTSKIEELMKDINKTIESAGSEPHGDSSTSARTNFWTRQISSDYEFDFFLFDDVKKKIVQCLLRKGFKAIGVHGMCGSGKTTLVDKVLKSPEVRGEFSPILKICLSDLLPQEKGDSKIVKHLLEVLGYDLDELTGLNRDIDPIKELKRILEGKKFLIVLDDVWFCSEWVKIKPDHAANVDGDLFTHSLPKDTDGAVIVTSRIKDVAENIVGNECLFHLKPGDEKENLEAAMRNDGRYVKKEYYGYIDGLPLAAKRLLSKEYVMHNEES